MMSASSTCCIGYCVLIHLHLNAALLLLQSLGRHSHFPAHWARDLAIQHELKGHNGCVNRLTWNEDGSLLASGSDDRRVRIKPVMDADLYKCRAQTKQCRIRTEPLRTDEVSLVKRPASVGADMELPTHRAPATLHPHAA